MARLAVHNVVQLSDEEICDRFVVRHHECQDLLDHLDGGDPPRHVLVIAPRGMGKSLLLHRVRIHAEQDAAQAGRWLAVHPPEEVYEVTSLADLWLTALATAAEALDDESLRGAHERLRREPDPARLEQLALDRLLGAARSRGAKVLLLLENLNMLLDEQLGSDDAWRLRGVLQEESDLLLIGSAVASFAAIDNDGEAFLGFFDLVRLEPLDVDETRTLWRALTFEDLPGTQAQPIQIITGGNPRLITLLAQFTSHVNVMGLLEDLESLIDEYTPYFKANIEALPAKERKVFSTLADLWSPSSTAEVARAARLDTRTVSTYLGRLVWRGAVRKAPQDQGPDRFELTERLYNLYHLLRRPGEAGRVRALVEMLTHLYAPADLADSVLPALVGSLEHPSSGRLETTVTSLLERHVDESGIWEGRSPEDLVTYRDRMERLLPMQLSQLGPNDPETLRTRAEIAYCIGVTGDLAGALALHQAVAADCERVLGPDHPHSLRSRHQVAFYELRTGNPARALALERDVLGHDVPMGLQQAARSVAADAARRLAGGDVDRLRQLLDGVTSDEVIALLARVATEPKERLPAELRALE